jgi:hypothetical protein
MRYMKLPAAERTALWASLEGLPRYLHTSFASLSVEDARRPGPGAAFSPVEQVWHLADLEREGFGERIRRLRREAHPRLPDFDGGRLARERDYRSRSLTEGLAAFTAARSDNVAILRALTDEEWSRSGEQDGVGPVSLCDLPVFMAQHDDAHVREIEDWKAAASF